MPVNSSRNRLFEAACLILLVGLAVMLRPVIDETPLEPQSPDPRADLFDLAATGIPTPGPTFTALPFDPGGYPAPFGVSPPSPAPNPTWMALDEDGVARLLVAALPHDHRFGVTGPIRVITSTFVYIEDAPELGVTEQQMYRGAYPDVLVLVEAEFELRGMGEYYVEPIGDPARPTTIFTAEPSRRSRYARFLIDRGYGAYSHAFSNDLDWIMRGLPAP